MENKTYENAIDNELYLYLTGGKPTVEGIDVFINRGADISAITTNGDDCILSDYIFSLETGIDNNDEQEIVRHLILRGADVNFNVDGLSPLWHACLKLKQSIVKLLIEHGANVNVIVEGDESLLDYARFEAHFLEHNTKEKHRLPQALEIVSILESAGALPKNEILKRANRLPEND